MSLNRADGSVAAAASTDETGSFSFDIGVTGATKGIINPQFGKPNMAYSPRQLQLNLSFKF